ncbi:hypothetical protein V6N12_007640 [Hibiscus sabdariffa]|uniref:Uncharacterized protein n=1 Tax=Hibiscus sabdariffa TaxID=183260 RepID=A0ABR2F2C7_9ROSI
MEGRIDGLEKKIEDIQGEIVQVKDFLSQLQDWMKKKEENNTEILRQLKGKATVLLDSPRESEGMATHADGQCSASHQVDAQPFGGCPTLR